MRNISIKICIRVDEKNKGLILLFADYIKSINSKAEI